MKCDFCHSNNFTEDQVTTYDIFRDIKMIVCHNCYKQFKIGEDSQNPKWFSKYHYIMLEKMREAFKQIEEDLFDVMKRLTNWIEVFGWTRNKKKDM